ncbi:hypothetical protein MSG28_003351 [Choristoneura fumiferana]|uniref:Uncharacterized protein n=1 Tax=Choristoneura fumiferana TaxID=7141 RepID=A0ACC0KE89_CHOFU|nr:hypothetical protein MSG28_003351 [Choristoneura fumiferana]
MVALHFNMYAEAANVKRKQALDLINDLEKLAIESAPRGTSRKPSQPEWMQIHDNVLQVKFVYRRRGRALPSADASGWLTVDWRRTERRVAPSSATGYTTAEYTEARVKCNNYKNLNLSRNLFIGTDTDRNMVDRDLSSEGFLCDSEDCCGEPRTMPSGA